MKNIGVKLFLIAILLSALLALVAGVAMGADPKCVDMAWKVDVYFEAGDNGDGPLMWSTLSPHQESIGSVEELQARLDWFEEQFISQRLDAIEIHPLTHDDQSCVYRVFARVVTIEEGTKTTDFVEYHVLMDGYGILGVWVYEQLPPKVEEMQRS